MTRMHLDPNPGPNQDMNPDSVPMTNLNPDMRPDTLAEMNPGHRFPEMIELWLASRITQEGGNWFRQQLAQIRASRSERDLAKALGLAPRKLGKADMGLSSAELAAAQLLRPGFDPSGWSVDQAARVAFILASFDGDEAQFAARLDMLADTAEINELIALYCGFALYPAPRAVEHRAREAIRSSMRPVFEAMAHRNPYPREQFDDAAWNQMIVKTFFLDSPLWPVQGIEQRANPALSRILVDLAHERWAAGRAVSPELWRCVGPHADEKGIDALQRVLQGGSDTERQAVALSLEQAGSGAAVQLRKECEAQGWLASARDSGWPALAQAAGIK